MAILADKLYNGVISRTAGMVNDDNARELASKVGLNIVNVTWEDTGRFKNSAVGPNISDLTIQVAEKISDKQVQLTAMPVIRYPNFSDKTADINIDKFFLIVGNHTDQTLEKVSLRDYLANINKYLSKPGKIKGSLVSDRDTHVLVSAQAAFLPVPKSGKAEFNPVIFNYQSRDKDPAVLTILATAQGSSATVLDNKRDKWEDGYGGAWGQRLFHNKNGERCSLTGERITDFVENNGGTAADVQEISQKGLDNLVIIQVPLKQKPMPRSRGLGTAKSYGACSPMFAMAAGSPLRALSVDIEQAVLGHGIAEGPYTELDGLTIERDTQFPIRLTVQMYKATSNGLIDEKNMKEIADQINRVYSDADWVGSLVTSGETTRPTEHGNKERNQPPTWWADFYKKHFEETRLAESRIVARLEELFGSSWREFTPEEMERVKLSGRLNT